MSRIRLLNITDRLLAASLVTLLAGTTLAFGGSVWWMAPAVAIAICVITLLSISRAILQKRWMILKSPLALVGLLALSLAVVQLAPLPGPLADRLSPNARTAYLTGGVPRGAPAESRPAGDLWSLRTPATLDRAATVRWLAGAAACLALFCVVAHFTDRLRRLQLVCGSVLAAFYICTVCGIVQLAGSSSGLYGLIEPGDMRPWSPSWNDLAMMPNSTVLRPLDARAKLGAAWVLEHPRRPTPIGGLLAGAGAYLALATIGLPLGLGLTLHSLAPRGSHERLALRLQHQGGSALVILMIALMVLSAVLVGMLAGRVLIVPFALGLVLAGLPAARGTGLRWAAVGLTCVCLLALGSGHAIGDAVGRPTGSSMLANKDGWLATRTIWADAVRIARDFPIVGAGLGSFATVHPYYKTTDAASTTALGSWLQWWAEAGWAGLTLAAAAGFWCVARLPKAVRNVGSADHFLPFALIGAMTCFALFAAMHWTVELAAVALTASAIAGICNRWLAGATDLFVEYA